MRATRSCSSTAASPSTGRELDELGVDPADVQIEHEGVAAGHAGGEVAAGRAEDDDPAAGHVLTPVVADALDHRADAGVAHAEPLPHLPPQEDLARGGAVTDDVARDDLLLGGERRDRSGRTMSRPPERPLPR